MAEGGSDLTRFPIVTGLGVDLSQGEADRDENAMAYKLGSIDAIQREYR